MRKQAKTKAARSSRANKSRAAAAIKRAKSPAKQSAKKAAKQPAARKPARKPAKPAARKPATKKPANKGSRDWVKFVEQHGVVLASARGPVPSVAEAIAGEPIVGSWWSHPKAQVIFDALSEIDDSDDVRCFKLVDGKITFVHRSKWPALAKLAEAGVIRAERAASIVQEHMPTGEHRNLTTPYPDWVSEDVAAEAAGLAIEDAKRQLGSWL